MSNLAEAERYGDLVLDVPEVSSLSELLAAWDLAYQKELRRIPLFDSALTSTMSADKKRLFAEVFYHLRGHFHDFLWFMGNYAPDETSKKVILANISEEFGGRGRSHEALYHEFAAAVGTDLRGEHVNGDHNLPFARAFNEGHMRWLYAHDWDSCLSAFAAYERLDNIDYRALGVLARSFGISTRGLIFFEVHEKVEHFEAASEELKLVWDRAPFKVKEAFEFIGNHQLTMWRDLSDFIIDQKLG